MREHEVRLHGHTVGYLSAGEGPLIVLGHGIASSSQAWREVIPRLVDRYTVVAPDAFGHGRSAKPRGDYSLGAYASGVLSSQLAIASEVLGGKKHNKVLQQTFVNTLPLAIKVNFG